MNPTWKSQSEIEVLFDESKDRETLSQLFSLSQFWRNAIYPKNYISSEKWPEIIKFADSASELIECSKSLFPSITEAALTQRLFLVFYHTDLLIDPEHCDIEGIKILFSEELRHHRIQIPFCFGRSLYDRFSEMDVHGRTDHLPADDAAQLLNGTPQGVHQMDVFVSGPFGILESSDRRFFPPRKNLPLWHCSDTGCGALHAVTCLPYEDSPVFDTEKIEDKLHDEFGRYSEWSAPLERLHRSEKHEFGRKFSEIPTLTADCFFKDERTTIIEKLLTTKHSTSIREIIRTTKGESDAKGSPELMASKLSPEEQLQIICMASDEELRDVLDSLIANKEIKIRPGEKRRPKVRPYYTSHFDTETEIGHLGLRSVAVNPINHLISLLRKGYSKSQTEKDLEWRLHLSPNDDLDESLMRFISVNGARKSIRELVFPSRHVTNFVCEEIGLRLNGSEFDENLLNRIQWKLGFNPSLYSDFNKRFEDRIKNFESTVLAVSNITSEDDREKIRGAGVNLFVSLEEFLENLVIYNTWILGSDHFEGTKFRYDFDEARVRVKEILGDSIESGNVTFAWDEAGGNTLGCTLTYLENLVSWIQVLDQTDRNLTLREENDLPHYAADPNFTFPFRHKQLWADSEIRELRKFGRELGEISKLLAQSNLAKIRNGLDHKRDSESFPTTDEMLACATRLRQALDLSEVKRYYPLEYWLIDSSSSNSGILSFDLEDYRGRKLRLGGPSLVSGIEFVRFGSPYLIAPGNLIGLPHCELAFPISYPGNYSTYWQNYPRRRKIPPDSKRVEDFPQEQEVQ